MLPDRDDEDPGLREPPGLRGPGPQGVARAVALLEVVICSDYPTQLAIAGTLAAFGWQPTGPGGTLSVAYVVVLSLADTVLLLGLIFGFLYAHGEHPRDVFLGGRSVTTEVVVGFPLILAALAIGVGLLATIQYFAPALHTVAHNPLQEMIRRPRDAAVFAVVVVVAGGVREELQRAFLLRRFERWLGGSAVGVVATSLMFGGGHLIQGVDAAITTATLGAFWAVVYLRRRSSIAPMVSHSGFNLFEIVQFLLGGVRA
jgi:membrane protease YdiL (CAAX protease family)